MPKLKLNPNPTFQRTIKLPIPEGGEGDICLTYKYRTRTEMVEFSRWLTDHRPPEYPDVKTPEEGKELSGKDAAKVSAELIAYASKVVEWDTDLLMEFVVGWDLDDEFSRENMRIFVDKNHRDFRQIALDDYLDAQTRAKAGN